MSLGNTLGYIFALGGRNYLTLCCCAFDRLTAHVWSHYSMLLLISFWGKWIDESVKLPNLLRNSFLGCLLSYKVCKKTVGVYEAIFDFYFYFILVTLFGLTKYKIHFFFCIWITSRFKLNFELNIALNRMSPYDIMFTNSLIEKLI